LFALQAKIRPFQAVIEKISSQKELTQEEQKDALVGMSTIVAEYSNVEPADVYDPETNTGLTVAEIQSLLSPLISGKDPKVTQA
jgi:hypothetical protein